MKRKISCPDFAFPLLDHDAVLDLIAAMRIKGVDIGLLENRSHLQPSDQFKKIEASAKTLREKVEDRGLVVSDIFLQCENDFVPYAANHPEPARREKARDWFLRTCEYAAIVGASHITGLPGAAFPEMEEWRASYDRCVEEMRWRVDQAAKVGIPFGIEAHIDSVVQMPLQAKQLCEDAKGLGLTLDYSHFVRLGMEDVDGDILIPYANHMHTRAAAKGVLQTCMSDNVIDFARIVRKLEERAYQGWYCMEYCWTPNWEDCARNDNISEIILTKQVIEEA